ncbi:MAG: hypothetical protein HQM09_19235 [Candidatus Riflebacteria bacterium]|nr:hypothetical protein [Candidatus Riflebacteria bacterium]
MEFRIIPRLEKEPSLLNFAQTIPGKLALASIFSFLMYLQGKPFYVELGIAVSLISRSSDVRWWR